MPLITGHNLIQQKAADAPLEFTQDAEILARCQAAVDQHRRTQLARSVEDEFAAHGITFVGEKA